MVLLFRAPPLQDYSQSVSNCVQQFTYSLSALQPSVRWGGEANKEADTVIIPTRCGAQWVVLISVLITALSKERSPASTTPQGSSVAQCRNSRSFGLTPSTVKTKTPSLNSPSRSNDGASTMTVLPELLKTTCALEVISHSSVSSILEAGDYGVVNGCGQVCASLQHYETCTREESHNDPPAATDEGARHSVTATCVLHINQQRRYPTPIF
ncbi:hypothetical protein BaRGS_00006654 [Batillaria attramentaria]|uniref:Uncharacterized protein n=1 Tax=Batillaria attramentaria TaxID=370345 RepID=A0ABD0LR12_9CAEN